MKKQRQVSTKSHANAHGKQRKSTRGADNDSSPSLSARRLKRAATDEEVSRRVKLVSSIRHHVAFIERHGSAAEIARMSRGINAITGLIRVQKETPQDSNAELFWIAELIRFSQTFGRRESNTILRRLANLMEEAHPARRALLLALRARDRDARLDLIQAGGFEASKI